MYLKRGGRVSATTALVGTMLQIKPVLHMDDEGHLINMAKTRGTVDDLMYLKRGGRVSATTALVGTMLQIKPVLHMDDEGHLINMAKTRGRKASIDALAKKFGELGQGYDNSTVFISHGDCLEDAKYLEKVLKERYGVKEVCISYVGAVIGLGQGYDNSTVFISHGDCLEDAKYLEKVLKERYGVKEVCISYVGAVIGSHAGPGTVALFFLGGHR